MAPVHTGRTRYRVTLEGGRQAHPMAHSGTIPCHCWPLCKTRLKMAKRSLHARSAIRGKTHRPFQCGRLRPEGITRRARRRQACEAQVAHWRLLGYRCVKTQMGQPADASRSSSTLPNLLTMLMHKTRCTTESVPKILEMPHDLAERPQRRRFRSID